MSSKMMVFSGNANPELARKVAGRLYLSLGKAKVGKMNTDANRDTPMKYNVQAIPTVMLFQGGQMVEKFVGLKQKKEFQDVLDRLLG